MFFIHFYYSFCCCYSSFISRLLFHVTGTPPWLLRPVKASTSCELYPDYFWLPLLFHLPRALRFWVGVFYPQAFFNLRSFTDTCIYQGFSGCREFFLEICRALYWSSKHRPDQSVCLIHSNPQKFYTGRFYLRLRAVRICEESASRRIRTLSTISLTCWKYFVLSIWPQSLMISNELKSSH